MEKVIQAKVIQAKWGFYFYELILCLYFGDYSINEIISHLYTSFSHSMAHELSALIVDYYFDCAL